ncbi:hypothetical protein BOX15_Mlig018303g4 [Macrostomum lignano]|uniref:Uncharacterized protein n=2 Tax=Macrostomum lignano TaxID=282301 RepID=A0A267FRV9_9PLAT|nr:hypothetical protein BOX15_Mlig018303g1 [Macrostomum lignano]PAA75692.1 hypothetical protein BOX15_Mlig018303g4 [Macrostomum lignano]
MSQGKASPRGSKSEYDSSSQHSSYGDSLSYTYSTYGSGSEPDYIMLEIRIKQQADDIVLLQKLNRRLREDLELERSQGMQRLKKLDAAAKAAEKRIQELSVELARSRDVVKHYQELQEAQENEMLEWAATKEAQDDRKRIEAQIQQLESDIAQGKEEMKNGNYESTQQRAAIRKAQEEKCIAQRLLEASEKEHHDLEKKLAELERLNRRQEKALEGAAQGWIKKNHEMEVLCEDLRWRMVDSKSGIVLGSHGAKRGADSKSAAGKSAQATKPDRRPKTSASSAASSTASTNKKTGSASRSNDHANNATATTNSNKNSGAVSKTKLKNST